MKKTTFKTLVRGDDKLGKKDYVIGVIMGIQYAVCKENMKDIQIPIAVQANGDHVIPVTCTKRQYKSFTKVVEQYYPGLCIFDVTVF